MDTGSNQSDNTLVNDLKDEFHMANGRISMAMADRGLCGKRPIFMLGGMLLKQLVKHH
jgi:hypothetical protein